MSRLLKEGKVVITKWSEGYVPVQIVNVNELHITNYNENFSTVEKGAETSTNYLTIDDDYPFFIETDKSKSYFHINVGVSPSAMRVFIRPTDSKILNQPRNLKVATSDENYGYIDGILSPYNNPSRFGEFFKPVNVQSSYEFYNDGVDTHMPTFKIDAAEYEIELLDVEKDKQLIRETLQAYQRKDFEYRLFQTMGSRVNPYRLGGYWDVEPKTHEELMKVIG